MTVLTAVVVMALAVSGTFAKELRILKPENRGAAYDVAAAEFQKYYELVCGKKLEIVTTFNDEDDYVVIGGDMVNRFVRKLVEDKSIADFAIKIDSDEYRLLSVPTGERHHLLLAGGRGRSTLYAVYEFFEQRCDCRWFWDGDVVPHKETIDLTGLDVTERPRLDYRGIRYFAHRGLHRFQAEHWSLTDWQKEIDWCVKKRLNMFMLRIGQDDLFQKAFPNLVSYPDASKPLPSMGHGYDNRSLFWSLEYRGKLRKQIMDYAFARDLMHPEDFGTMTHWYSPTPQEFIDKVNPVPTPQASGYSLKTQQVWDIRMDVNLDNYWKITKASIDHYGKPELFHTIGFAERMVYENREDNLKMKTYFYRRMIDKIYSEYPNAKILLASWDFYLCWNKNEVPGLLKQLNPNNTLVLDYTLDLEDDTAASSMNLTNWNLVGQFPYIAGLFLAYENGLDIRGRYECFQEQQKSVFNDPYCKGLVLWPESSHTDIFMLNYFTGNAWKPNEATTNELLTEFCATRYGQQSEAFLSLWRDLLKPSRLLTAWGNFWNVFTMSSSPWEVITNWSSSVRHQQPILQIAPSMFERMSKLEWPDEFARRDSVDLARTLGDRLLTLARVRMFYDMNLWREGKISAEEATKSIDAFRQLAQGMTDLLALHEDYSMNDTLKRMNDVEPIQNPDFGQVLIENATCDYCMSHQYEAMAYWYLPTFKYMTDWAKETLASGKKDGFAQGREQMVKQRSDLRKKMNATPLSDMAPTLPRTYDNYVKNMQSMQEAAEVITRAE
ncbi:MAG: alpha-N-acetylglucosaminidase TIM-barrel domain-containing protein [Planctomycetia bacterium]|nr:alpha-N-acetylglucosaminidase TIM-barrel domain-containing protein [Planctomycetia bacterium]